MIAPAPASPVPASRPGTRLRLSIGGVLIGVEDSDRAWCFAAGDPHAAFLVDAPATPGLDRPDLDLKVRHDRPAPRIAGTPAYSTEGGLWNLGREDGAVLLSLGAPAEGGAVHRVARMDEAFTRGEVFVTPAGDRPGFHPYPLRYPLDELLVINHLARGRGAIFHAAGLVTPRGTGWLFVGRSGAGKSTMSRLWAGRAGFTLLSDDRIILRPEGTGYRVYGTPWHGDAGVSSPGSAPLEGIFLLEHAPLNEALPAPPGEAARRMLVNCFAPFYDAPGMEWTLGLVHAVVAGVRVDRLRFRPDPSAVDYLMDREDAA